MLIDLTASIHGQHVHHLGGPIRLEQNAPAAHAGFPQAFAFGERRGKTGIEWILRQQNDSLPDAALRGPVQAIKNLLGFVGNVDLIVHSNGRPLRTS